MSAGPLQTSFYLQFLQYRPLGALALVLLAGASASPQSLGGLGVPGGFAGAAFDKVAADADAARKNNDTRRAIELYSEAVKLKPEWMAGWRSLGLLQYSNKAWADARDAFTHYIELAPLGAPAAAQAVALRGLCEFQAGEYPQSLSDLEQSIRQGATNDPDNERMLRIRQAQVLTRVGRFEESLSVYSTLFRAGQAGRSDPELTVGAGLAGLRAPLLPAEVPPDRREFYSSAGDAALRFLAGEQAAARQAFAILFQRFPGAPNVHYLFGFLMLPTEPDATVAEYKRELEVAPANVTAAAMLAWVLQTQGEPAQALPYADKAVDEAPTLPVAQLVLGRSLAETGDLKGGIEHLEEALQLQPGYLETHVALATAYARAGRSQDALRERQQSLLMAKASDASQ